MIAKLAIRNVTRNRWRTALTVGGIAIGVALLVWTLAYMEGFIADMVRGATSVDQGQVQIASASWFDSPAARHSFEASDEFIEALEATEGVDSTAPRVSVYGLVGTEERSVVGRIVGVDPVAERETTLAVDGVQKPGRWLSDAPKPDADAREAVVGVHVAEQIGVGVGDELVVFFEAADGSLGNDLVRIVGLIRTGTTQVDRRTVYMHIDDLRYDAALGVHQTHAIAVRTTKIGNAEIVADRLDGVVEARGVDAGVDARSWEELMPEMAQMLEISRTMDLFLYALVYLIVALGLLNAQRMSALERRREFAMMMAIGVSSRRLFWVVLLETFVITVLGAALGLLLGWAASWYFVEYGLDMSAFMEGEMDMTYMGVSFSDNLHFVLTPRIFIRPVLFLAPVALLCGLWPALQAVRTDIASTLAGRN